MRLCQPSALGTSDLRDASAGVLHAKDALGTTSLTLKIQDPPSSSTLHSI